MRFLLLNTDYPLFLDRLYAQNPGLDVASYDEQLTARNRSFFGVGDAYARALRKAGHDAFDIHVNNVRMQAAWLAEHGVTSTRLSEWRLRMRRHIVPSVERVPSERWMVDALARQIAEHRPDVVLNHDMGWIEPAALRRLVGNGALLIGQQAAPPIPVVDYRPYDLVVSSWPPTLARMRAQGIRSEHLGLGFDPAVLDHLGNPTRDLGVTFVGSFTDLHRDRTALLDAVCRACPDTQIYAPSVDALPRRSAIRRSYVGPAYGIEMFDVLARSRLTINHHGFPEPHANNMRLFEATGVGTTLVTDARPDLARYFVAGREVLTYADTAECVRIVSSPLPNAPMIAKAGQERTLRHHTWQHRIGRLLALIEAR